MANKMSTSLRDEEEISDVSLATFYVFEKENGRATPPARYLRGHRGCSPSPRGCTPGHRGCNPGYRGCV